jgi:hypothetical protein
MVMAALEDENTQKAGMVIVGYNMGPKRALDRQAVWGIQKLRRVLPMRVVGMHYCYDDFKMRPMMTLAMLVMGSHGRMRFRAHYGKQILCACMQVYRQAGMHVLWLDDGLVE